MYFLHIKNSAYYLLVRLSFGLKQTKKAAREKFRKNFYKKNS